MSTNIPGLQSFSAFLHYSFLPELATSIERVNSGNKMIVHLNRKIIIKHTTSMETQDIIHYYHEIYRVIMIMNQ